MKWQQTQELFNQIKTEAGNPPVSLVAENEVASWNSKRLAGEPYRIVQRNGDYGIVIKFRDRTLKAVARYLHQAIAQILWPGIPYWKQRWHGLVMSQPDEYPTDVKLPEANAHTRSRELALTVAQTKRKFGGQ